MIKEIFEILPFRKDTYHKVTHSIRAYSISRAIWGIFWSLMGIRKWQVMIKNGLERINMDEIKR